MGLYDKALSAGFGGNLYSGESDDEVFSMLQHLKANSAGSAGTQSAVDALLSYANASQSPQYDPNGPAPYPYGSAGGNPPAQNGQPAAPAQDYSGLVDAYGNPYRGYGQPYQAGGAPYSSGGGSSSSGGSGGGSTGGGGASAPGSSSGSAPRATGRSPLPAQAQSVTQPNYGAAIQEGAKQATNSLTQYGNQAIDTLNSAYTKALGVLNPYTSSGGSALTELNNLLGVNGSSNQSAAIGNVQNQPGYKFGLNQGIDSVQKALGPSGGINSVNAITGINKYAQDYANTQIQNQYSRLAGLAQLGYSAAAQTSSVAQSQGSNLANTYSTLGQNLANTAAAEGAALTNTNIYANSVNNSQSLLSNAAQTNNQLAQSTLANTGAYRGYGG